MKFDKKVLDKWTPYVDKHLRLNNTYLEYISCHYLEFLSNESKDIGKELVDLQNRIGLISKFRKEIKKEIFNSLTGRKEYQLEDDTVVDPENFINFLDTKDLLDIFGLDFLKYFDLSECRSYKLNEILENENRE